MEVEDNNDESTGNSSKLHVAVFPWFGFGHIMPFVQLSNKLAVAGVKVTFISTPGNVTRTRASLKSPAGNPIDVVPVRVPPVDGLPPGVESTAETSSLAMGELLKLAIDKMAPDIEALLAEIRPHAVIYDFCHDWLPGVAGRLGIKAFFMSVVSAMCLAYHFVAARKPPGAPTSSVEDMRRPPPGLASAELKTFQAKKHLFIFAEFGGPSLYDRAIKCIAGATAVVVRSCVEMEAPYIKYIEAEMGKPIILSGPIIPEPSAGDLDPEWRSWLDRHPENSVIFCSFGSETQLEEEQIRELSLGLEMTKMPFILVLNLPKEGKSIGVVLPEGFEERVKGRGMVRTGWVPQQHILGHPSVGCFLNHGGYGSLLEGLINGCLLVLLPLGGDQFFNSMVASRDMGAGVEVKRRDEDGYFGRDDVFEAVEAVMGERAAEEELGKRVRSNHKKWMEFFREEQVHQRFMTSFVKKMKQVIFG